jgi:hypothetical protein
MTKAIKPGLFAGMTEEELKSLSGRRFCAKRGEASHYGIVSGATTHALEGDEWVLTITFPTIKWGSLEMTTLVWCRDPEMRHHGAYGWFTDSQDRRHRFTISFE